MATQFHLPVVTAAQVGTYFVGQYYQVLQTQPELVHQFYSDASTMIRVDGSKRETAAAMLQIHTLVMSLNYAGVEIKTLHSLESWNGGVLVMISGSVLINGSNDKRKFVQTFFLAPQETGYFVLNDIFHFIEEEAVHHHPVAAYLGQNTFDPKANFSASILGPVSNYIPKVETQSRDFVAPAEIKENGSGDNYGFSEQQLQQPPEVENIVGSNFVQSNTPLQDSTKLEADHVAAPVEDHNVEPPKHTYASILQVTKGPPVTTPPRSMTNKPAPPASEWDQVPEPPAQQSLPQSTALESSVIAAIDDHSTVEEEVKSVYVKNLPPSVSTYEVEEVFKKFGELKPNAVAIRSRKDVAACYAFVEFEDITGVQNAIQASTVELGGQQVYIEGRRANRANESRGGRIGRGRGRGGYHIEASRGRYAPRNFSQRNGQEGDRNNYNKPRTNGYYQPAHRQDRGSHGNRVSRSGVQTESE